MANPVKSRILVVDDHFEMARLLADQLNNAGYETLVATSGDIALEMMLARAPDLVLTDLRMDGMNGLDLLERVHAVDSQIPVLIMTAYGAISSAIEAVKRGAYHYLTKPFEFKEVQLYVERALAEQRLRNENRQLRRWAVERSGLKAMVGASPPMVTLYDLVERIAGVNEPVLIRGESGTGKELVARALHGTGPRKDKPFVAVNCTALPEALLESELFGHVRGAFTGATSPRRGLFVEADLGTLYLDEIGDMPPNLQAKLLRVIEDGEVRAVGADNIRSVDVRIIASTHQPIEQRVQESRFRADLFYRLNVVPIAVPPLRDRIEDLPLLVSHFLHRAVEANPECKVRRFSQDLIAALARYPWPGNVRELENLVKRLSIVASSETVSLDDLARHAADAMDSPYSFEPTRTSIVPLRQVEDEYIAWAVQRCGGNKTKAANALGIDVSTIHRREKPAK